jgi:hypothetical protein
MSRQPTAVLLLAVAASLLAGCDMLGIESAQAIAARRDAEGRAIGGACRHAGRAIEDCFEQNRRADKAAIFAGWREMNDYMRENRMDTYASQSPELQRQTGERPPAEGTSMQNAVKPTSNRGS